MPDSRLVMSMSPPVCEAPPGHLQPVIVVNKMAMLLICSLYAWQLQKMRMRLLLVWQLGPCLYARILLCCLHKYSSGLCTLL
jgi:hypothetical protein